MNFIWILGSISKLATDSRFNLAISCGYDKAINIWSFPESRGPKSAPIGGPSMSLKGHENPVLDFYYNNSTLCSGARDGTIFLWDLESGSLLKRNRGHTGPVSVIDSLKDDTVSMFISGGADGTIKLWDPREKTACVLSSNIHGSASITGIAQLPIRGQGNGCYVVTSSADNTIALLDPRRNFEIMERYEHAKNSIYSICSVGDGCIFIGDGTGMMYCYDMVGCLDDPGLKYAIGASERGAVRCLIPSGPFYKRFFIYLLIYIYIYIYIYIINNKYDILIIASLSVVSAGEDGKIIVFSY
jgi:WD40 repeat protein